jgi:hypothetical protein
MPTFLRINNWTDTEAEIDCEQSVDQSSLSPISTAGDGGGKYRSDCYINSAVNGCFERTVSVALGLGRNRVQFRDIIASANHRHMLYMLLPAERRRLNDAIQLERYHIERTLAWSRRDVKIFRMEYDTAMQLVAPIQWLPVELLASIFSFIPDEQNQKFDTLMKTCRRWKEIVSSFWAPLKLATWTPLDEVKATLEGANGLLSVTIDPSMDSANPPVGSLESERYAALVLAISTSISRWKTLDILSLPDPHEATGPSWDQNHLIDPVPMEHLRSLSIPIRHDTSQLLTRLLPSIGATTSDLLTDMHICSVQAMSYLAQPHCAQIFKHLTIFRCLLPRMDNTIDILPHFRALENLDVSGVQFLSYASPVELPLTQTLRQMSLKNSTIDWMDQCRFDKLEKCFIMSPLDPSNLSSVDLPVCMELHFEGPQIDMAQKFHPSTASVLTIRCSQWSKLGGNIQIGHLYTTVPTQIVLLETLHLHLTCSGRLLLEMLRLFPILKSLVLDLERPSLPGRNFWRQFLLESNCEEERPQFCPSLESVRLRYRRWFRSGESNDLHALVAIVRSRSQMKSGKEFELWVQKGPLEQGEDKVDTEPSSTTLCSLDFLRPFNGLHPPIALMEESINISLKTLISTDVAIAHPGAIEHLSPLAYSSLFRWLRAFTLPVRSDQKILFDVLPHFEHLEELFVSKLTPPSPLSYAHLPLLRTLKRMYLGETCLLWMEGCIFGKLEYCRFDKIMDDDRGKVQSVRMPACTDVLLPPNSVQLLDLIDFPVLDRLHLSTPSGVNGWESTGETPWRRQFQAPKNHPQLQGLWIPKLDGSSKLWIPKLDESSKFRSGLDVLEVRWNGKASKDEVVGTLAALMNRANVDKKSDPDRTRYIPGSSGHCSNDSSDGRPRLEKLHLKLNSTPKPLRYAIIHGCHQLIKKKWKLLQSCQIWWEEEAWNQEASMELIWQPVFNEPRTTARPPEKLVDSIQERLEPQVSKSTYTATYVDELSIWDEFTPRSRKSGRQREKRKEKKWRVCRRSIPGYYTGTIEPGDSVEHQGVAKGIHGRTTKIIHSKAGILKPEYKVGHNIHKKVPPVQRSQVPHAQVQLLQAVDPRLGALQPANSFHSWYRMRDEAAKAEAAIQQLKFDLKWIVSPIRKRRDPDSSADPRNYSRYYREAGPGTSFQSTSLWNGSYNQLRGYGDYSYHPAAPPLLRFGGGGGGGHDTSSMPPRKPAKKPYENSKGKDKAGEDAGRIPRPRNSWILYRSDKLEMLRKEAEAKNKFRPIAAEASRIISEAWKNESPHVKKYYNDLADKEKARHAEERPEYRFQPKTIAQRRQERQAKELPKGRKGDDLRNEREAKLAATSGRGVGSKMSLFYFPGHCASRPGDQNKGKVTPPRFGSVDPPK